MKVHLGVTIDTQLLQKIDRARGREKRSTFVEHLLRLGLESHLQDVLTSAIKMSRDE